MKLVDEKSVQFFQVTSMEFALKYQYIFDKRDEQFEKVIHILTK
jgi:hypothetical protein